MSRVPIVYASPSVPLLNIYDTLVGLMSPISRVLIKVLEYS